ncbi:hypothetical protein M513_04550, partial [Trichuris suis]
LLHWFRCWWDCNERTSHPHFDQLSSSETAQRCKDICSLEVSAFALSYCAFRSCTTPSTGNVRRNRTSWPNFLFTRPTYDCQPSAYVLAENGFRDGRMSEALI